MKKYWDIIGLYLIFLIASCSSGNYEIERPLGSSSSIEKTQLSRVSSSWVEGTCWTATVRDGTVWATTTHYFNKNNQYYAIAKSGGKYTNNESEFTGKWILDGNVVIVENNYGKTSTYEISKYKMRRIDTGSEYGRC